jgi:hypothetical protein
VNSEIVGMFRGPSKSRDAPVELEPVCAPWRMTQGAERGLGAACNPTFWRNLLDCGSKLIRGNFRVRASDLLIRREVYVASVSFCQ